MKTFVAGLVILALSLLSMGCQAGKSEKELQEKIDELEKQNRELAAGLVQYKAVDDLTK